MWENHENFLFGHFGKPQYTKTVSLILYDLDNTVIEPIGKVRPGAPYDKWQFVKGAKARIQKDAKAKNTILVFVTNQLNLPDYKDNFEKKVEAVMKELGVSALFYAAVGRSAFRKPSTDILSEHLIPLLKSKGVETIASVVYVGDAAGRAKDFNDSDRKFLGNIHLLLNSKINPLNYGKRSRFKTPEEYFQGQKPEPFKWEGIEPKKILDSVLKGKKPSEMDTSLDEYFTSDAEEAQEIILMIGPPASGKSTIAKQIAKNYNYGRVNQDELGSKAKVIKAIREFLQQGKSVVVDNTNLDPANRKEIIKIAQKYFTDNNKPIHIRAFHVNGDWSSSKQLAFAQHLNIVRQRINGIFIKDVAYRFLMKKFEPPSEAEGFTEIVNIPFIPRFKNVKHLLSFLQKS